MRDRKLESYSRDWRKREEVAELMVPLIGKLYRDQGVVTTIYDHSLVRKSTIEILKAHRFTRHVLKEELSVSASLPVLQALSRLDPGPARIDVGKLAAGYEQKKAEVDVDVFLRQALSKTNMERKALLDWPQDVVLYGFGRVGRMLARILIQRSGGDKWRLRAVVTRKRRGDDLMKRASLLRRDSVHGRFNGAIVMDREENALVANGNMIRILYADAPEDVNYCAYGIQDAVVVDNAGIWAGP